MKQLLGNTVVQIAGKAVMVMISLVTTGILTRKMGAAYYGSFVLITSMFVFLDALADFGTKIIGVREVSKGEVNVLGRIVRLKGIMTAVAWTIGMAGVWGLQMFENLRWEATLAMTMVWLTAAAGVGEIVFQSKLKMGRKVIADIVFPLLFLGAVVWYRGSINLMWVFGVYLGARVLSLIVGWKLVESEKEIAEFRWKVDRKKLSELWRETWPMGVFLIVFAAYDRLVDSVMIQNYLGAKETAFYGLAYKIYMVLLQPAYFYVNSVFPLFSGKNEGKRRLFWGSLAGLMAAVAGVIGVTTWLAPWMIEVLGGAEFGAAAGVLRILVWGCLFSYAGHLLGFSLIAKGGQGDMLKLGLVALVFNVGMNWAIIPYYGINGAAWVTVMTEAVDMGLMGWFLWRKNLETRN